MTFYAYPFILTWPSIISRDQAWKWELVGTNASGGKSLTGAATTTRLDGGGLWSAQLQAVQVSTPDQIRAWRALASALDGGATPVVMEARDARCAPWPTSGGAEVTSYSDVSAGDSAKCSDGAGFSTNVVSASVVNAAALRATTLTLSLSNASALRGGEQFSIQHPTYSHRLYRVASVTVNGSGQSVVTIRPPLREAVTAGTFVEFNTPKCVMKLATPDAMDLMLTRRVFGETTLKLIEEFPPFNI